MHEELQIVVSYDSNILEGHALLANLWCNACPQQATRQNKVSCVDSPKVVTKATPRDN